MADEAPILKDGEASKILAPDGKPAVPAEAPPPLWHKDINFQTIIPLFGHHFQAMSVRDDYVILAWRRPGKKKLRTYIGDIKKAGRIG